MPLARLLLTLFLSCFIVAGAGAHSSGRSFEKEVGVYLIDIGYADLALTAEKRTYFDFYLFHNDDPPTWQPVDITAVEVMFRLKEEEVIADTIEVSPIEFAGNFYTVPEAGMYDLNVRFMSGTTLLAEATFPVEADVPPSMFSRYGKILYLWGSAALMVIVSSAAIISFFRDRRRS
jgi:hypothetical protein